MMEETWRLIRIVDISQIRLRLVVKIVKHHHPWYCFLLHLILRWFRYQFSAWCLKLLQRLLLPRRRVVNINFVCSIAVENVSLIVLYICFNLCILVDGWPNLWLLLLLRFIVNATAIKPHLSLAFLLSFTIQISKVRDIPWLLFKKQRLSNLTDDIPICTSSISWSFDALLRMHDFEQSFLLVSWVYIF